MILRGEGVNEGRVRVVKYYVGRNEAKVVEA